jgi:hypothetical protein
MPHGESGIVVLVREILEHCGMAAVLEPMELVLSPVTVPRIHPLDPRGEWRIREDVRSARRWCQPVAHGEPEGGGGTLWQATEVVGLH